MDGTPRDDRWIPEDYEFALCLTHDVDRPYKTYQGAYYAIANRDPSHLLDLLPGRNPYWAFDELRAIEEDLGVRSAFYFLSEQSLFSDRPPGDWLRPSAWRLYAGRYDLEDPAIVDLVGELEAGGWEIGLHGSYEAVDDRERLAEEKERLDTITEEPIAGGRQHYLRLVRPNTWEHYRSIDLSYDATPGSSERVGFQEGYRPFRPFDDDFVVFPLTIMDDALPPTATNGGSAWTSCERLLEEAASERAVMTVLWHPRYFSDRDYPGFGRLYRHVVERALEMGAWVGPPGELYERTMVEPVGAR